MSGIKFTIEGFSQVEAVKLSLSVEDLVILRWFVDFYPAMDKMNHEGKEYALVNYGGFIEQMPIISCNKRTIARKFQRLVEVGVLENTTIKQGGTYSVYSFGKNYINLCKDTRYSVSQDDTEEGGLYKVVQPLTKRAGVDEECTTPLYKNVQPNTNLLNTNLLYNNIYNNINKTKIEKKKIYKRKTEKIKESVSSFSSPDACKKSNSNISTDFNVDANITFAEFYERVSNQQQALIGDIDLAYAFRMLYAEYPKKAGKKAAAQAFFKYAAHKDTISKVKKLAVNIDTYKKYCMDNGTEQQYIKQMQGFINDTQDNEYPRYDCQVMRNGKFYETKDDYVEAVLSGELPLYCLPQSCITF